MRPITRHLRQYAQSDPQRAHGNEANRWRSSFPQRPQRQPRAVLMSPGCSHSEPVWMAAATSPSGNGSCSRGRRWPLSQATSGEAAADGGMYNEHHSFCHLGKACLLVGSQKERMTRQKRHGKPPSPQVERLEAHKGTGRAISRHSLEGW